MREKHWRRRSQLSNPINIAIIGAKSLKGREIKEMLERSSVSIKKISFYDPSVESEWSLLTDFRGEPYVVKYPDDEIIKAANVIIIASGGDLGREFAFKAKENGIFSIDLSSTFSEFENIPLIVDGINHELIEKNFLIANPHPVSIMLSHIINQLMEKYNIKEFSSLAFQPVSEYQEEGMEEFINQTVAILNATSIPKKVFKEQRAFNLIPEDEKIERKITKEIARIVKFKPSSITLIKAPVFHCFAVITFLSLDSEPSLKEIEILFKKNNKFKIVPSLSSQYPTPTSVAGREGIFIKVIKNPDFPSRYSIWSVADNLRSGFVNNAIKILQRIALMS